MKYKELKQGTFRWRKKFRYLPTREQLAKELGIEWLANRLYYVMFLHIARIENQQLKSLRVSWLEFDYIIQKQPHEWVFEILQQEPKHFEDYGKI